MTTYVGLELLVFEFHSLPSMALQPLLGPKFPQKTPPFFCVFCSSPPSSYSQDLSCVPQDDVLPPCSWFSHWSSILNFPIKHLLGGIFLSSILKICPAHRSLQVYEFLILISWDTFALDEYDTLMSSAENFAQNRYPSFL
jgi:hypothetical protein